ncbi:phage tail protein [Enterobacter kobei]
MAVGTISLVNGSTALTGSGSSFLSEVTPGDFIYVEVGDVPCTLPVEKVSSDTSITLLRKFIGPTTSGLVWTLIPRRAQNAVYSKLADQVSQALRQALTNEDNWQKLLTENGNVTITRPDGSSYTGPSWVYLLNNTLKPSDIGLDSARHLADLNYFSDGFWRILSTTLNNSIKFDGAGFISGFDGSPSYVSLFINPSNRAVVVGAKSPDKGWVWNNLTKHGDYGLGAILGDGPTLGSMNDTTPTMFTAHQNDGMSQLGLSANTGITSVVINRGARPTGIHQAYMLRRTWFSYFSGAAWSYDEAYTTRNTTKASDGTLKAASPIVKLFADGSFETNEESDGVTVTRLDVGQYLIEGCEALNSDATWGGWDGGFDIPTDRNKQPLIWLDYDVNPDGSVLVKTYHRTHPDSPEFARNCIGYKNDAGDFIETVANGDPVDIPSDQFVSVRVEMPQDSIWNQRQKEIAEMMDAETSNQESTTDDEVEKG